MKGKSALGMEFFEKGKVHDCPIYDMHGHMGTYSFIYLPYPEPEGMVKRMDRSGVEVLAFCHHSALSSPDFSNMKSMDAVRKFPERLKAYYGINPHYPEILKKDLETIEQNKDVFIGMKFHSANGLPYTHVNYQPALEYADERELLVLLHTWGSDEKCGEKIVKELAHRYKRAKIIMGHSCHGKWDEAAELAKDFQNVYLELCAVLDERLDILEKFVNTAGSEKILFGTDFPWFNHHNYIGTVIASDITDEDRRNIFYRNAKKLLAAV